MKILLTADPEIPVPPILYGGIERVIDMLVNVYVQQGHDVTLLAHPDSKVPCRLIPWKGTSSQGFKNKLVNTAQLSSHAWKETYDVIHSFSRLAYLMPLLPSRTPKVMSYQREPTLSQIKKATTLARKGTLVFTGCSNYITNQMKPIATAATVYNCVPIERYNFTPQVDEDAPLIFLGRIEPIKGTHIAVEIAKKTNRRLVIAGNIPAEGKDYFEEKIKPFLNERITYIGPVNDAQKNEMLGQSAAFLMPIQWNEPFGIVMAEAMACGTPVIGFPFGSVPEVVENGVTGFICMNEEEMAAKIRDIPSISRLNVRRTAEERFSDRVIASNYLRLYADLSGTMPLTIASQASSV
ncbi:MAG: glycosyltransferase family 4 protein [Chitinophagaceae bacterium]|nr:MAG: glycosyltransferase family 4 protein [Chitinophagaceae bacterium]